MEIIFGSSDSKVSQSIGRALRSGALRKIKGKIYTDNMIDPLAKVVGRNIYIILGKSFPEAVISHRSALEGGAPTADGYLVLTYKYTKTFTLPGYVIKLIAGDGQQVGDTPFIGGLYLASRARTLLDNLQTSRTINGFNKNSPQIEVENYLDKICSIHGSEELNKIRDQAKQLSIKLKYNKEYKKLDSLIGTLLGTNSNVKLHSKTAIARAKGNPFDNYRSEIFAKLTSELQKKILPNIDDPIVSPDSLQTLAFFESYFSNYIEGTKFAVNEAEDIVFQHKISSRPEDAHDVLGTFQIVSNSNTMRQTPNSAKELVDILKERHTILLKMRRDKNPGKFKEALNQAGNTLFVAPELVVGTLTQGFTYYQTLTNGLARAIFMMFLISEVHPFVDGNGRIARIMMNAELVHAGLCRIIIPTVFREDYMLSLKRLSKTLDPDAYIMMLVKAQKFTASIDYSNYDQALEMLKKSNAFKEPYEGKLLFNFFS